MSNKQKNDVDSLVGQLRWYKKHVEELSDTFTRDVDKYKGMFVGAVMAHSIGEAFREIASYESNQKLQEQADKMIDRLSHRVKA